VKSPKTYLILLLAVTTVGGAILAWQQYAELVELRAAAMNKDERADYQKRIWDLEKANRELQDRLAANREPVEMDDLLAAATDGERPGRDRGNRGDRGERGGPRRDASGVAQATALRELMNKPEVQAMLSLQQKAAIEARYAALFKELKLPVEQIDKLKTLLADRGTTMQDVMAAAREQGINPRDNREAFMKLVTDAQNEINNGIKSVIGEQGFAQLTNYEQTMPQRNLVNELQQRLSYTSTPLTAQQAEQMVQILSANAPPRQAANTNAATASGQTQPSQTPGGRDGGRGGFAVRGEIGGMIGAPGGGPGIGMMMGGFDGGGRGGGGGATVTPGAVAQAQTILAPTQVAALQQIQQQQQTQQQLRQLINDTMVANQPQNTKSGNNANKTSGGATAGTGTNTPTPKRRGGG
jgi:hypothetical protein